MNYIKYEKTMMALTEEEISGWNHLTLLLQFWQQIHTATSLVAGAHSSISSSFSICCSGILITTCTEEPNRHQITHWKKWALPRTWREGHQGSTSPCNVCPCSVACSVANTLWALPHFHGKWTLACSVAMDISMLSSNERKISSAPKLTVKQKLN
jgi:hypothetical protein